jgi:exosortase
VEQVRDAARQMGIENPLVWVACPPAAEVIDRIPAACLVYQRTDRFEHYPGVNAERIRSYDLALKAKADVTLFCSTSVFTDEQAECRKAVFVDHGVDYDAFSSASSGEGPEDVREIPHPRIGFVGGIDIHTFDPELFVRVAEAMPDCSFVMVGGCSLPLDWCTLDNVHFLGRKPYEEVASYMAACDVLIMPWNRSPWIKACNPVKLKEYLAAGRPVVSTPFDELARYSDHVEVAEDADGFVQGIRRALESPPDASRLRERVVRETWAAKAESAFSAVEESGINFRSSFRLVAAEAKGNTPMQTKEIPATQQADPAGSSRRYWRTPILIATALLALAGLWVTADAWNDIFRLGTTDEESSHVLLAIPAALWIAWTRRTYTSGARRTGTWLGPALVAFGWLLFAYGDIQLFQSIWHFGAICIVVGCIVTIVGQEVFLRLWPAFAVLLFLIPVPGILRMQIAPPMQTVTAQMTAYLLQTFGEPVTLSGKVLIVNDVSVGIAEACNGIRMVFALALVCFFYAFSTELSTKTRLLIVLASPLIAILVNILRLVPTVWLYGHAEVEFAEQFHDLMGWAMMPIALFGLIGLRALLSWALKDDPDAPGEFKDSDLSGARPSEG